MAREKVWYTRAGTNNAYGTTFTQDVNPPDGTILRMIGTVLFDTTSNPPGTDQYLAFGWGFNVGTAAFDPIASGVDPEGWMIRKVLILPGMGPGMATAPIPEQSFDVEGRRIMGPGETLWFTAATIQPTVTWLFAYELRVLVLLPEA